VQRNSSCALSSRLQGQTQQIFPPGVSLVAYPGAAVPGQHIFPVTAEEDHPRGSGRHTPRGKRSKELDKRPKEQEDDEDGKVVRLEKQVKEMRKVMKQMITDGDKSKKEAFADVVIDAMMDEAEAAPETDKATVAEETNSGKAEDFNPSAAKYVLEAANPNTAAVYCSAASNIQACWRGRRVRKKVAPDLAMRRMQMSVALLQTQMTHLLKENTGLRQALSEESRRRMIQEEALRSLWGEVQHLQSWAEQVSDGQDASFDLSQVHSFRGSPAAQTVLQTEADSPATIAEFEASENCSVNHSASSRPHGPSDSVTYW